MTTLLPVQDSADTNVRVAVRIRPLSNKEKSAGEESCFRVAKEDGSLVIIEPHTKEVNTFGFDLIFEENCEQGSLFDALGRPTLEKAFKGFNGTIFAYGQTGSGKTWSMQGSQTDAMEAGIIPRINNSLFERIEEEKLTRPSLTFLVTVSYFEIYNEIIFDLLDGTDRKKRAKGGGLEIKEHPLLGVYVKDVKEIVVDTAPKLQQIIDQGMRNRTVASTNMNADSSRR